MIKNKTGQIVNEPRLILTRLYEAPVHKVFQAFIDPELLKKWYTPNPDWKPRIADMKPEIFGGFTASFGDPKEEPWVERTQFLEITPPSLIRTFNYMTRSGAFVVATRAEFAFLPLGAATQLTLVETGAPAEIFEGRINGWGGTLDNLVRALK